MSTMAPRSGVIPERLLDLLSRQKRAFASLAITLKDGSPHVSPIWFDFDGKHVIINTARGRVKDRVLRRRPWVALSIIDPANPYRWLLIRGPVVDETEVGAYDVICDLAEKYKGLREYPKYPGEVRVTYRVLPEDVYPRYTDA